MQIQTFLKVKVLVTQSCLTLCDPWTVASQAPLSMGFSRQEYWSELPFSSPGDLPNPGIETWSPALQADSLQSEPPGKSTSLPRIPHHSHCWTTAIFGGTLFHNENPSVQVNLNAVCELTSSLHHLYPSSFETESLFKITLWKMSQSWNKKIHCVFFLCAFKDF